MWPTFETENPVEETEVLEGDMRLATLAFGFTIGFGWFVAWNAFKQTRKMRKRNTYIIMCWLEFLACSALAIVAWLRLCDFIGHSFWLYFFIVTLWVLQLQFLLQIIVSRICIMLATDSQKFWLKATIAIWVTVLSVPIYCIWIPAKLQISETYIRVNWYWNYIEKCLYLLTDAALNFIFIRVIRQRLVSRGLKRYDKLISLNIQIITVSLAFDVVVIGMLSYRNDRVSLQFHPVAFMAKLAIEMYMSRLMVKVANGTELTIYKNPDQVSQNDFEEFCARGRGFDVRVTTQVVTCTDDMDIDYASSRDLEHGDDKLPSLNEANLEGQLWLNHLDPLSSDGREIARIASGAWHPESDSSETPKTRCKSRASQDSDTTFKAP